MMSRSSFCLIEQQGGADDVGPTRVALWCSVGLNRPAVIKTRSRLGNVRRAALLAAILVAVSSGMPLGHATAQTRTYVINDCLRLRIMPRYIMFTCADGGFYMTQGDWTTWHRYRAVGSAVFHSNDCNPSCAGGTFHTMRGRIVLHRRTRCPDLRRRVFTRAMITIDGRLFGRHRYRAQLPCPV